MKKKLLPVIAITIAFILFHSCGKKDQDKSNELSGQISLSGAFALYPLALQWGKEFSRLHPKVKIDVSAGGAGKGMADVLSGNTTIGMVSRDINPQEEQKGAFKFSVAKDAVVPTINGANKSLGEILKKGVTKEQLIGIWITGKVKTWGELAGNKGKEPVKAYTRSDAGGAAETWAKFLGGKNQEDLLGTGVFGDPGLLQVIKKDVNGIGYNNVVFVYDLKTKMPYKGVKVIPLDINKNGKLDSEENFYDNMDSLMKAISNGVYPSPPARELYFVTKWKPQDLLTIEFIKWVLTEGQHYVSGAGYVKLPQEELHKELDKLK